ncbi:MAG TPA: hypothetical protein VK671_09355 [Mucilaginibacter sp.]|jgi:hypothetical protein|nr:hypothetical protein [Mucilaginibacter sp.]
MTPLDAQQFGRRQALKATALVALIPFSVFLYLETRGDFANGILFFIQGLLNVHVLIMLAILFGLTFVLGGKAGKEIILHKKNYLFITFKYAIVITSAIIVYAAVVGILKDGDTSYNDFTKRLTHYLLEPLLKTGSLLIIPMLLIWLWATNQIRLKINANPE